MKKIILFLLVLSTLMACRGHRNTTTSTPEKNEKTSNNNSKGSSSENKKADQVIKTARSYSGTPYKYGGTTKAGMDCSGLTSVSYKAAEIAIPRTAGDQSNFGKVVSLKELKKGDLIFFTDKKGNKKVTHVGMVTEVKADGSAKFIHASTKLGVVEVDLFSDYYKPLILRAVRVL